MICLGCGAVFCWDYADESGGYPKLTCTRGKCQREVRRARARFRARLAGDEEAFVRELAKCVHKERHGSWARARDRAAEIREKAPIRWFRP